MRRDAAGRAARARPCSEALRRRARARRADGGAARRRSTRIVAALDGGGGPRPAPRARRGAARRRCTSRRARRRSSAAAASIVLVPEIALTPQTVGRFRARFGDRVAVLHSALTDAERRDERERIAAGDARVVVGARSAIFAPVARLGLVIVDEEHDASYKQESDPRYDARTVAAKRAALEGAVAVYGSATPRAESWARLERLELPSRIGAPMPTVKLVDLRREAGYPLSAPLLAELAARRGARRPGDPPPQSPRGLRRRSTAAACGTTRRCRSCDIALTLHADSRLHCHHCGYSTELPESLSGVRLGRARADRRRDAAARGRARAARSRARADPARRGHGGAARGAPRRARAVRDRAVGRAHRDADGGEGAPLPGCRGRRGRRCGRRASRFPTSASEERTFQLVTQLAGRSGRDAPGRVIVQTFQPDATPFAYAVRHDVAGFLAHELARREELAYPPFSHLVSLVVSGPDPGDVRAARCGAARRARRHPDARLLGPAPLLRLRGRHRAQLLAKTTSPRAFASAGGGGARARRSGHATRRPARPSSTSIRSRSSGPRPEHGHWPVSANCATRAARVHRRLHSIRPREETPMKRDFVAALAVAALALVPRRRRCGGVHRRTRGQAVVRGPERPVARLQLELDSATTSASTARATTRP